MNLPRTGGDGRELLRGLLGQPIARVHANPSQVALEFAGGVVDIQPGCARVREGSVDEVCFAALRCERGGGQELPRDPPIAVGVRLTAVWSVRTCVCFAPAAPPGRDGRRRWFGSGPSPVAAERLVHPQAEQLRGLDPQQVVEVEAGWILGFGEAALAVFCADNAYRFALPDAGAMQPLTAIVAAFADRYQFDVLPPLTGQGLSC